jgi:hypothetical protein
MKTLNDYGNDTKNQAKCEDYERRKSNENYTDMKYSTEKFEAIAKLIRNGVPARHAAIASDINESSFYKWLKEFPEFQALIKKAESERLATLVLSIRQDKSWQSKAWLLERLYARTFSLNAQEREELETIKKEIEQLKANGVLQK